MKITIDQKPNKQTVLSMMNCFENSPVYNDYVSAYDEIIKDDMPNIELTGYYVEKQLDEAPVEGCEEADKWMFCICSISDEFDKAVDKYFVENDFVKGMILNTIGDYLLFESSQKLYSHVKKELEQRNINMTSRFEPGMDDLPVEVQKDILDVIHSQHETNITLSTGFMYTPQKTLGYFYGIGEKVSGDQIDHDCRKCNSTVCVYRKSILTVTENGKESIIQCHKGTNMLHILRENGYAIPAYCNGKKACGKCKIKVVEHEKLTRTEEELKHLTEQEIKEGIVLACFHKVNEDFHIHITGEEKTGNIMADYELPKTEDKKYTYVEIDGVTEDLEKQLSVTALIDHKCNKEYHFTNEALRQLTEIDNLKDNFYMLTVNDEKVVNVYKEKKSAYGIAVDLGTTTVVLSLVNLLTGEEEGSYKVANPQRKYGADVISRIHYDASDEEHIQGDLIRKAIKAGVDALLKEKSIVGDSLKEITLSGNTTMQYLLLGYNPFKLSIAPFTTVDLKIGHYTFAEVFKDLSYDCDVTVLPSISAYIGADITSGFYYSDLLHAEGNVIFIDIGTNGEMALKTDKGIICASTAAGPALEGANIKCGMSSLKGAINHIRLVGEEFEYDVIGGGTPKGICGSALVDVIGELLRSKRLEATGYMNEPYYDLYKDDTTHVAIYQEDVRQYQLAKSAIAAGVEVMLKAGDLTFDDVDAVYLAGGFGNHLDIHQATVSGLIHESLENKVKLIGNSALGGCARYMIESHSHELFADIQKNCRYIELSMDASFNDAYMNNMMFM